MYKNRETKEEQFALGIATILFILFCFTFLFIGYSCAEMQEDHKTKRILYQCDKCPNAIDKRKCND